MHSRNRQLKTFLTQTKRVVHARIIRMMDVRLSQLIKTYTHLEIVWNCTCFICSSAVDNFLTLQWCSLSVKFAYDFLVCVHMMRYVDKLYKTAKYRATWRRSSSFSCPTVTHFAVFNIFCSSKSIAVKYSVSGYPYLFFNSIISSFTLTMFLHRLNAFD